MENYMLYSGLLSVGILFLPLLVIFSVFCCLRPQHQPTNPEHQHNQQSGNPEYQNQQTNLIRELRAYHHQHGKSLVSEGRNHTCVTETETSHGPSPLQSSDIGLVLTKIWEARVKWYNLGIQLKVATSDLDAIQHDYKDIGDCLRQMITYWLRNGTNQTWDKLIAALSHDTVGFSQLSRSIALSLKLLDDLDRKKFKCPQCGKCAMEDFLQGQCPKFAENSDLSFPDLDTGNLSEIDCLILQAKLRVETNSIITEFSDIIFEMRKILDEKGINPQEIVTTLLTIARRESSTFSIVDSLDAKSISSLDDIFQYLLKNNYLSFLNYHIAEYLIGKYGQDDQILIGKFHTYKQNFDTFCRRTVFEVPTEVFGSSPQDGEKLAFKVTEEFLKNLQSTNKLVDDVYPTTTQVSSKTLDMSLKDTLTLQEKIAKILGLKESKMWSLVFLKASRGCIELTFSAPKPVMEYVKPNLNTITIPNDLSSISRGFMDLEDSGIHILCGPPGKPFATDVTANNITIHWTKPEYDGFHPIECYRIHYRLVTESSNRWKIVETIDSNIEIGQLAQDNVPVIFKVQAINRNGAGIMSNESDPIGLIRPSHIRKGRDANKPSHQGDTQLSSSTFTLTECPLQGPCAGIFIPIQEMIKMPGCSHSFCKECFKRHFTIAIQEKQVKHFNCPICNQPNMSSINKSQRVYQERFLCLIKNNLNNELYELCQKKLHDFNFIMHPGFLQCAHDNCHTGFINEGEKRHPRGVQCPNCNKFTCWKCKRPWEIQHKGISCEQFAQWKWDSDPEGSMATYLKCSGIKCPACHAQYEVARGGCIHFKCAKCPNEFCGGCGESMKQGEECRKFRSCITMGLHAHHPRDCLFYLRDLDVDVLQAFLRDNHVKFNVGSPKEEAEAAWVIGQANTELHCYDETQCYVMEQKETADGLKDEICGNSTETGQAGLCKLHYKEYLVTKINLHCLDPIVMYDARQIMDILSREEMEIPKQQDNENEEQFRERLIKYVQVKLAINGAITNVACFKSR